MTSRTRARTVAAVGAAVAALGVSACGGGDEITSQETGKRLSAQMDALRETLTGSAELAEPWSSATREVEGLSCGKGEARWLYLASFETRGPTTDGDGPTSLTVGRLDQAGWKTDLGVGDLDDHPVALVPAYRTDKNPAGTTLDVTIQRGSAGWHYVVSARTTCHSTG